jgi:hypothetical protein
VTAAALYVYDLTTPANDLAESSVGAVVLSILDRRPQANLTIWTVVATKEQMLGFRDLPWVMTPRQRGTMNREGDDLVFRDSTTGETLSVTVEELSG